jgi:uncharacterized protein YcbK (DUF882 family)
MTFKALDISFPGIAASTVYAKLVKWRANGKFTGGLGSYPGFTHIDTRNYNTNW